PGPAGPGPAAGSPSRLPRSWPAGRWRQTPAAKGRQAGRWRKRAAVLGSCVSSGKGLAAPAVPHHPCMATASAAGTKGVEGAVRLREAPPCRRQEKGAALAAPHPVGLRTAGSPSGCRDLQAGLDLLVAVDEITVRRARDREQLFHEAV